MKIVNCKFNRIPKISSRNKKANSTKHKGEPARHLSVKRKRYAPLSKIERELSRKLEEDRHNTELLSIVSSSLSTRFVLSVNAAIDNCICDAAHLLVDRPERLRADACRLEVREERVKALRRYSMHAVVRRDRRAAVQINGRLTGLQYFRRRTGDHLVPEAPQTGDQARNAAFHEPAHEQGCVLQGLVRALALKHRHRVAGIPDDDHTRAILLWP